VAELESWRPAARAALTAGARELKVELEPAQIEALLDYLALMLRWNAVYNLTAVREPDEMVTRHLLDSLALMPFLDGATLVDLGSGAGLPGIPLAIAMPALQVILVEANGKKARFLREAQRRLALANVRVVEARAEGAQTPEPAAMVTARALASLGDLARLAARWLRPDGRLLAMKGPGYEDEIRGLPAGWNVSAAHRLRVPGLDAERALVVVKPSAPETLA
jgi:16S rRNA (guanine527-N7)-methyltransferase